MTIPPPVALSIAGSDNSCGAGAQADLKSFSASGVYGLTAITCVVAEVPGIVSRIDPVMIATSGTPLLQTDAVQSYRERLFPLATLITPNADELAALTGRTVSDHPSLLAAAAALARETRCAILAKGGHLGGDLATDHLVRPDGTILSRSSPFNRGISTHGTGCSFSALIAARLALGLSLEDAFISAKVHLAAAIAQHHRWNLPKQTDALHHFAPVHIPDPKP